MEVRHLTYRLSRADHAALAALPRVPERWWLICLLATAALLGGVVGWESERQRWLADMLNLAPPFGEIAVIGVALGLGYGLFLLLRAAFRAIVARRLARETGEVRLTTGPQGLAIAASRSARMLRWREVRHVAIQEERILLAAADGTVVLIPRSAFTGRAAMLSFANAVDAALKADDEREEAGIVAGSAAGGPAA
ncbi:hypothetical protein BH10PSE9_BH10PSE9_18490 [soil metagenome]